MNINQNRTKIIATIGPSCQDYDTMVEMVNAGVDVFRLNFAHGTQQEHLTAFQNIKKINEKYGLHIASLADLQGPKIRLGKVEENTFLREGENVIITTKPVVGNNHTLYVNYERLPQEIRVGDKILINDGKIELKTLSTNSMDEIITLVVRGGAVSSNKGVNLPDTPVTITALTEKDIDDLRFILEHKINWVALSFVRTRFDILELKKHIPDDHPIKVIAKIEKPEAVKHIDEIIAESDGIMVARGDLGVELPVEQLPLIQKEIVRKCCQASKPVIIATQIMESMIENPMPTRAEVTDVANNVLDGADALMLSGETSVGKYPVKVVETLNKIICYIEKQELIYNKNLVPDRSSPTYLSDAICYNACKIAEEVGAKAIIGMTHSGYTAFMLSSYRPHAKIYIFTDNADLLSTFNLFWGVEAFFYDKFISTDTTINDIIMILKEKGLLKPGDVVVNTGNMPIARQGRTNMVKITKVD